MAKKFALMAAVILVFTAFVRADEITLKDDQHFKAEVRSFDSYYLTVELPNGKMASIPWNEVRLVRHTTTESSWLEETYMTQDDAEVTTLVTPLKSDEAMMKALFPGLLVHGSGHFYSKDQNMGMSLLSAEILSVVMMGISVNEIISPVEQDQSLNVSKVIFYTGLTIFVTSWLWDVVFSSGAADRFNTAHSFLANEPAAQPAGAQAVTGTAVPVNKTEEKK